MWLIELQEKKKKKKPANQLTFSLDLHTHNSRLRKFKYRSNVHSIHLNKTFNDLKEKQKGWVTWTAEAGADYAN